VTDSASKPSASIEQLFDAMEKWGASDLFVAPGKAPAVRLHGAVVPLEVAASSEELLNEFLARVLDEGQRQRFASEGDLDLGFSLPSGKRFRLNLARQLGLPQLVARAVPKGTLSFAELGLPECLGAWAERPRGLILVTGATGAGKSTTLAAMVHHVNQRRPVHIVTLEEPVEFVHEDIKARISQREVGTDTRSFEVALRQVLRESPDVILIGELRSAESIRAALQAALTGHLVLGTLHTVDVSQTLQRILSAFPEHEAAQAALDLSLSLTGIASQRLLPRADGQGRVAAVERLDVTPAAARLIREGRIQELQDLMRNSQDDSVITFDQALIGLFRAQQIRYEAGLAYASHADEFALAARGMNAQAARRRDQPSVNAGLDMQGLLQVAVQRGASDLHLSVGQPPALRVSGQLQPLALPPLNDADVGLLLNSVMSVRQRSNYELDRELDFSLGLPDGQRFRVNAYHERGHRAAAFRAINSKVPDAVQLGLPQAVLDMGGQPHGLLLVVGPTGSGKTTTLACLVDRINATRPCHVLTIEDPIEYIHKNQVATVHQREVISDTASFSAALRYILRQDPDVVMIGEMRDFETVSAALTAAETGHLVLATLHTNDAVQTIDRIIDVFPPHQQAQARSQLAASLIGVVSQRLLMNAKGGGRLAAFEIMVATAAIRTLIRDNKMHQALGLMQAGQGSGMQTMDAALEALVRRGMVDKSEALRYMLNPAALERPRP